MNKRPVSVIILGCLFILIGAGGMAAHLASDHASSLRKDELIGIVLVQMTALVGGAFLLFRANWARWLLAAWMAFHIGISFLHSAREVIVHVVLFSILGYFLFRPATTAYFRPGTLPLQPDDDKTMPL